jgi:hypothetical protein
MAQVPYTPIPDVTSRFEPTPNIHVDTPLAAFGGDIGHALSTLGTTSDQVGNELFARANAMQELHNQSVADQATSDFMQKLAVKHAQFTSQYGENAGPDALAKYGQEVSQLRKDVGSTLTNPMAQQYFNHESLSTMGRTFFNAAQHSGEQVRQYSLEASNAQASAAKNLATVQPTNQRQVDAAASQNEQAQRFHGSINGSSPDAIAVNVAAARSGVYLDQIQALLRDGKVAEAEQAYQGYKTKGQMIGQDLSRADEMITNKTYTVGAKTVASRISASMPDANLGDQVAAGIKQAQEAYPDKPLIGDYVRNQIESDYAHNQEIVKNTQNDAWNTVRTALQQGIESGKTALSIEALRASDSKVAAAIDTLSGPKDKPNGTALLKLQMEITQATKESNVPTDARTANFQKIYGQAHSEDTSAFRELDLGNIDLTASDRKRAVELQSQVIKTNKPLDDPNLESLMRNPSVSSMLSSAGVSRKDTPDDYNKFKGALGQIVHEYQVSGKVLSAADGVKIATTLLQDHATPGALFGDHWQNHQKIFQVEDLPDGYAEKNRPAIKQVLGRDPTDEEIQRWYRRDLFNKALGSGTKQ